MHACVRAHERETYRAVQPPPAVHCDKQPAPDAEQADHSSVHGGDLQQTCTRTHIVRGEQCQRPTASGRGGRGFWGEDKVAA